MKPFFASLLATLSITSTAATNLHYTNPVAPEFPILAWFSILPDSAQTHGRYKELHDAGFNISFSHFYNNDQDQRALDAAEGTGVKIMFTSSQLYNDTRATVEHFGSNTNLAGWFLRDEPIAPQFKDLADFRDRIADADSTHILYLNLFPSMVEAKALQTRDYEDYVQRFVDEVRLPLISFDFYPIVRDEATGVIYPREQMFENLEIVRRVANRNNLPFWAFCLSTAHDPYPVPTYAHMRYEAFAALAYGAQGIQYFTYWQPESSRWNFHHSPIDETGRRTDVYYMARDLNREIQALAPVFLGATVDDVAFTGNDIPIGTNRLTTLPDGFGTITTDGKGILVSQFHNGDNRYLMLFNRDIDHAQTVSMTRPSGLNFINPDGTQSPDNGDSIVIAPGSYQLLLL